MTGGIKRIGSWVEISLCLSIIWIVGCQDCDDCGPLMEEPVVNLRFINQDSLEATQASILLLEESVTQVNTDLGTTSDSLQSSNTLLQTIEFDIANGVEGLDELRADLNNTIDSLQATLEGLQELRTAEEAELSFLNGIESDISNGLIFIDSLVSRVDMTSSNFGEDSLAIFRFPLSVNLDSTAYGIFINGIEYDLTLEYDRNFDEDERSRIEIVASNVTIEEHSFREIEINCEVCPSDETTITAYF